MAVEVRVPGGPLATSAYRHPRLWCTTGCGLDNSIAGQEQKTLLQLGELNAWGSRSAVFGPRRLLKSSHPRPCPAALPIIRASGSLWADKRISRTDLLAVTISIAPRRQPRRRYAEQLSILSRVKAIAAHGAAHRASSSSGLRSTLVCYEPRPPSLRKRGRRPTVSRLLRQFDSAQTREAAIPWPLSVQTGCYALDFDGSRNAFGGCRIVSRSDGSVPENRRTLGIQRITVSPMQPIRASGSR